MTDPQPQTPEAARPATPIDRIAEDWVDTLVELDPTVGTRLGRAGSNARFGDYSPSGLDARADAERHTLAALAAAAPVDEVDEVTRRDLSEQLALRREQAELGLGLRDLNVIVSPVQAIRNAFDLMPRGSEADWAAVATRLHGVAGALAGYRRTLAEGARRGITPALRQVREVAAQAERHAAADGFFPGLVAGAGGMPAGLRAELAAGAAAAATAYAGLADFLRDELAPAASERDGVGREHYQLASREFLGATVDLDESYAWGIEELARMTEEQASIAREIVPGGTVPEAIAALDADPARILHGTRALRDWLQETSDRAVAELGATQFDIPAEIRRLDCMIAPTQEGGIYYTGPSDDFSRPGQMWWSVPRGVTEFKAWRELTTVYHEGVPGHHLQMATAVVHRNRLNSWRRQLAGTSGHFEGWALYAERFMAELGFLDDPGARLGMLDGQRMRAARVVLDLGVHLGKPLPDGSGRWDAASALAFMTENVTMNPASVRFEVNRYLGWPGQAPSYKIGQRIWEQLRDEAAERGGADFDLREFHREALGLGSLGLDTLAWALRRQR
ncbi:DUF885 domain-containing protein [Leucobacter sp. M11]|uniref:DUF885 domain-containing protein n=1 Tax=Leucobacter sp. M11 TaxID=2993565 RepID=UPI002D7E1F40|nr:DUF885 domain-containing protein [Leucobacter sp. M11]MEB4613600.1 DUF885 domain-containing protein [Leucobacter sp. M11]